MLTGIDHVVIAVPDLAAACEAVERGLGLAATEGGRHPQLGTENRLIWLGDSYVELLGVFDRALAATSWIGAPALRALQGGGGGFVALALASNDLADDLARLRAHASTLRGPTAGERVRPDGAIVRWLLALPPALGSAHPLFLIEHDRNGAEWDESARLARATLQHPVGGQVRLSRVELSVPDLQGVQRHLRYDAGLSFRPSLAGGGARDASVGEQTLRLRGRMSNDPGAARPGPAAAPGSVPTPDSTLAVVALRLAGATAARRPFELGGVRLILEGS